ncbi:hypothetical protein PHLGIDRAFT_22190 [Phlebiopsis gigantea 11061_1 CR5-6]|uniref:EKC/KEOPS complex subunit CGI121 n=1 Tax=Phlebiopsis gigantea (strain 11061_1 CR5-6) TaxID=745531 RepID=A0A0C3NYL1_PHLG1|nr:hypothetical protein PHLGIDRAFT_22190 [Phlebiopsis gigantea 11061_1 CR5-6]
MESFCYPQFPPQFTTVYVALFTEVENAAELKKRLVAASVMPGEEGDIEREAVNFAFIDARLITSALHLQTAIYHAVLAATQESLRTKTVHSEVLWTLNPSHNISEAFRRYGVSDDSKTMFVARIGAEAPQVQDKMKAVVKGKIAPFSALSMITDWAAVKKHHKLNNETAIREASRDTTREHTIVDQIVTSTVAMKSVMT